MTIEEIKAAAEKQANIHNTAIKIADLLNGIAVQYDEDAVEETLRLVTEDAE